MCTCHSLNTRETVTDTELPRCHSDVDESAFSDIKESPEPLMDSSFKHHLKGKGVSDQTITTLLNEEVHDIDTFLLLKESHFAKLGETLSLGQHALLIRIWEDNGCKTQDT